MNKYIAITIVACVVFSILFAFIVTNNVNAELTVNLFIAFISIIVFALSPKQTKSENVYNLSNGQSRTEMFTLPQNIDAFDEVQRRMNALKDAQIYLKPYKDIYNNLELVNRYCSLKLKNGVIYGKEKYTPDSSDDITHREFFIEHSYVISIDELWNMYCKYFAYNTHYQGLVEIAEKFKAYANEKVELNITKRPTKVVQKQYKSDKIDKVDINNCSEMEMTALSGINIVMAKKAIKKREEIGGFKKVDDFILFLHLKPHLANNLRSKIYVSKMKGHIQKHLNQERSVDL